MNQVGIKYPNIPLKNEEIAAKDDRTYFPSEVDWKAKNNFARWGDPAYTPHRNPNSINSRALLPTARINASISFNSLPGRSKRTAASYRVIRNRGGTKKVIFIRLSL